MTAAAPTPQQALGAYAAVQRAADRELLAVLREAYRANADDLTRLARSSRPGTAVRRDQLRGIQHSLLTAQAEIFRRTGQIVEARRTDAAIAAIRVAGRYDEVAFAALGRGDAARALSRGLEETEARSVDVAIARMTGSHVPLSARVYRTQTFTNGMLQTRINSALARGLNAQQMAVELRDFINPNTPGGVRFAAMRLARTEINNAYHAMAIRAAQLKPWITHMEWHKSASHKRPDICDTLDGKLFPVDEVPPKPHPQDMCVVTPVVGATPADDEAFLDALAGGQFDSFLNQFADVHGIPADPAPTPPGGSPQPY